MFKVLLSVWVLGLLIVGAVQAEQETVTETLIIDDNLDPKAWGIHNNCINLHHIKRIDVKSDDVVYIEVTGGKKVMMNFKNTCRGLKYNGYIHSTRTNNLCAKFDSIRVINNGRTCVIESFVPVTELDNQPVE